MGNARNSIHASATCTGASVLFKPVGGRTMKQDTTPQQESPLEMAQLICQAVEQLRAAETVKRPLMLDDGTCMIRIEMEDIIRVEADRVYCHLYVIDRKRQGAVVKHTLSRPLCEVEKFLPAETFVRIHRSHIINIWKVRMVMHRQITLDDGTMLTMGESYTDCLNGRFWVLNKPYPK